MATTRLGIGFTEDELKELDELCKRLSPNGLVISRSAAVHYAVRVALKAQKKGK